MERSAQHWIRRKTLEGDIYYDTDTRKVYRNGAHIVLGTSQDFYSLPTFDSRAPLKVYFDFTYLCNLECRHCITNSSDGDGERNPEDISLLVKPIYDGKADLVLGTRRKAARMSESLIGWLINLRVKMSDSCTGFRVIRKDSALGLQLKGQCTRATFVLEADYHGARVIEGPVKTIPIDKPRKTPWHHIGQTMYVPGWLLRKRREQNG